MNTLLKIAIILVVAYIVLFYFVPLLGAWAAITSFIVVIATIVALLKTADIWF